MDDLVKEVIPLLQYLIPGFLTAWTFYSLTAFKRPDTFGQIVQALIFTFVIHLIVTGIEYLLLWLGPHTIILGEWDAKAQSIWSALVACAIGGLACYLANNDKLHRYLRSKGITKQTSYPSEWYSAFTNWERFVVLHLVDERRLFGWPLEWPTEPTRGQFVIQKPAWLDDDGIESALEADLLTIDASKVQWVEFSTKTW